MSAALHRPATGYDSGPGPRHTPPASTWTKETTAPVADRKCNECWAVGLCVQAGETVPCQCVLRRIYQSMHARYQQERTREPGFRPARHSRPSEEFIADFELCARRTLTMNDYDLFRRYVIWDCPVPEQRKADLHRVQLQFAKACAELRPYALWPVYLYFGKPRKSKRA